MDVTSANKVDIDVQIADDLHVDSLLLAFPALLSRRALRLEWWLHKYFGAGKAVECERQERHLQNVHNIVGSHFGLVDARVWSGFRGESRYSAPFPPFLPVLNSTSSAVGAQEPLAPPSISAASDRDWEVGF